MKFINPDLGKLLLRIGIGVLMLFHGVHKLSHGFDGIKQMLIQNNLPENLWIGAFVGEVIAPLCIIFGFATRLSSYLVAITMMFSIYMAFGWDSFKTTQHGGLIVELNLIYIFASLALAMIGAGKYAMYKKEKGILS